MIDVSPKNIDMNPQSQKLKEQAEWYNLEYGNVNAEVGKFDLLDVSEKRSALLLDRRRRSRNYVKHQFEDNYHEPILQGRAHETTCSSFKSPQNRPSRGVLNPFPIKLHELLSQVEKEEIADIISWQPHGRSFMIRQPQKFAEEVMSRYFNQSKMRSFQRQLCLYGFRRLTKGADNGGYYHELFLRGYPDLCSRIIPMKIKSNGTKPFLSPDTESQIHTMEPCVESIVSAPLKTTTITSPLRGITNNLPPSDRKQVHNDKFTPTHSLLQCTTSSLVSTETSHIPLALPPPPRLPLHANSKLSAMAYEVNNGKSGDTFDEKFTPTLPLQSKASPARSKISFLMSSALSCPRSLPSPSFALSLTESEESQPLPSSSCLKNAYITNDPCRAPSKSLPLEISNLEKKLFFEGCPFYYLDPPQIKE